MQRMYDGSFDMRISMSLARLALNWVAAWRCRNRWMKMKVREWEGKTEAWKRRRWPKRSCASRGVADVPGSPVDAEHWNQCGWLGLWLPACNKLLFKCARVCVFGPHNCQGIPQRLGASRESPADCPHKATEGKHSAVCFAGGKYIGMCDSLSSASVCMAQKTKKRGKHISPSLAASCHSAPPCQNTASGSCSLIDT